MNSSIQILSRRMAWWTWFLISLFYAYQYVLRVLPSITMTEIMAKFQIDAELYGQFSGIYYLGYAGAHIPLGILLDRKGPRLVIPICILLAVIGMLPLILTDTWIYPVIGRFLVGLGSSASILGAFKIIRMGFEGSKFSRMLGMCVTIGLLGAIYGGQPVNYFVNICGWQSVVGVMAGVGVALAGLMYACIPEQGPQSSSSSLVQDIKNVVSNRMAMAICFLAGLMVGPLEGFADVWGTEFLRCTYKMNDNMASSLPSFIFVGMCFGSPLLTYIADRTQRHFLIIILAALVMTIGFATVLSGVGSPLMLAAIFVLIGIMCAYQILAIYKASTFVPERLVGLTTAVANMVIMSFGYFFHSTIGMLIQSALVETNGQFTKDTFVRGLSVIPLGALIAGLGFLWIARKHSNKTLPY